MSCCSSRGFAAAGRGGDGNLASMRDALMKARAESSCCSSCAFVAGGSVLAAVGGGGGGLALALARGFLAGTAAGVA